jgi:signal recognition particle subunit SRP54
MTKKERENPDLIHSSRIQRIARGSGTNQKDVRDLLKQYNQSKKMIKQIGGVKGMKRGVMKDLAKKFGIKF